MRRRTALVLSRAGRPGHEVRRHPAPGAPSPSEDRRPRRRSRAGRQTRELDPKAQGRLWTTAAAHSPGGPHYGAVPTVRSFVPAPQRSQETGAGVQEEAWGAALWVRQVSLSPGQGDLATH